jgi:hypothetical protein
LPVDSARSAFSALGSIVRDAASPHGDCGASGDVQPTSETVPPLPLSVPAPPIASLW